MNEVIGNPLFQNKKEMKVSADKHKALKLLKKKVYIKDAHYCILQMQKIHKNALSIIEL